MFMIYLAKVAVGGGSLAELTRRSWRQCDHWLVVTRRRTVFKAYQNARAAFDLDQRYQESPPVARSLRVERSSSEGLRPSAWSCARACTLTNLVRGDVRPRQ